jgi:hypothetical protein
VKKNQCFLEFKNPGWQTVHLTSEMEFLDINLTKELNLLLHAINNSTGGFTEPFSSLVLKNLTKKIRETRKLKSVHE